MNEGAELQEMSEIFGGLVYGQGYLCTTGGASDQLQCRYTMAKIPCGLGLANTAFNAPATQGIWNLRTPTPWIHIRAWFMSGLKLGFVRIEHEATMDSLSQLDAAGLSLGKVICYAILFTTQTNKEHINTTLLETQDQYHPIVKQHGCRA